MEAIMTAYDKLKNHLLDEQHTWLITGVAGFIGSNLLEMLLQHNQKVIGLDNFSTGFKHNLEQVRKIVSEKQWSCFTLVTGDICNLHSCRMACTEKVEYVLHQAALGSIPRSIADPVATNAANITGFLNMLTVARDVKVKRFVYASSSSVYGDSLELPKNEKKIGNPLSPYSVTKLVNEQYADVFMRTYAFKTIGLRYFNIFGARQNPNGAYAAVIPKWISAIIRKEPVWINGDGKTSRDFCYIENAVQANLLAATTVNPNASGEIYNVAVGAQTTLNDLFNYIRTQLEPYFVNLRAIEPNYRDFRAGDVQHSLADINKAKELLGYVPACRVFDGIMKLVSWYINNIKR
jgi:UDP-N-acetylglucosamine 4-epimerase